MPSPSTHAACLYQVTFDEKSPQELLQILNDVLAELDSAHERDVRDEVPEVTGPRIINFLAVLKFPLPPDMYGAAWAVACRRRSLVFHAYSWRAVSSLTFHGRR